MAPMTPSVANVALSSSDSNHLSSRSPADSVNISTIFWISSFPDRRVFNPRDASSQRSDIFFEVGEGGGFFQSGSTYFTILLSIASYLG